MTPDEMEDAVNDIVTNELGPLVKSKPDEVDTNRTFSQVPPQGYDLSDGAYASLCDNVQAAINAKFPGANVKFDGPWRTQHYDQSIAIFISNATDLVPGSGG